jgi:hypothetical protein
MKPVLQALVLAERIYEDKSGKKIIAGTFNHIMIGKVATKERKLPDGTKRRLIPGGTDPGCPAAYISLTDVVDGTELALQFFNVSKNVSMFRTGVRIEEVDRLATVEIIAPLPPFSQFLKEAGTYSLDVVWQGEILGSHRLRVSELSTTGKGE